MTIPILIANVLSNWIDDIVIKSDIAKILRYTINISDIKINLISRLFFEVLGWEGLKINISKNTVSKSPKIDSIICLTPYLYFSFIGIIIFILILNIKYDYIDFWVGIDKYVTITSYIFILIYNS